MQIFGIMMAFQKDDQVRIFDYSHISDTLRDNNVCNLISAIREYRGKQALFMSAKPEVLKTLLEIARIQSTAASNKIEGISTTDARLKAIMAETTVPRNRNEEEIAGYRDVLGVIHESHDVFPVTPNIILQLHRDLCKHMSQQDLGGHWKTRENVISETDPSGVTRVRFQPMSAFETPDGIQRLCDAFRDAHESRTYDDLLLIPLFILDFLCIHPFADGNGRMSRLLTLLLLYHAGYLVGKYVSIEKMIEQSKETYYDALQASSTGWQDGTNDAKPFVRYFLGLLLKCYRTFEERVSDVIGARVSKPDRVRIVIDRMIGKFTKAQLLEACPDISETTMERTLKKFLDSGVLRKVGSGRGASYCKL